jgi:prophage antirepressor-like protein
MRSRRKEAEDFQDWVFETLKEMRQATGLEGFQVFRMLDKEHQKDAMKKLRDSLRKPVRVDFIKANTIANKAVSSKYGHPMLIKKDQMTPNMLVDRQGVLDDTVDLMDANERFNLGLSVSEKIYEKHVH